MIQHVDSGTALTTGLVNNIIDQANGQQIPSTNNFRNEKNGTLFIPETPFDDINKRTNAPLFLDCYGFDALHYKLEKLPWTYGSIPDEASDIFVNLGATLGQAKSLLTLNNKPVDGIVIVNKQQAKAKDIEDDWYEPAKDPNISAAFPINTGFINTGLTSINVCFLKGVSENSNSDLSTIFILTDYNLKSEEELSTVIDLSQTYLGGDRAIPYNIRSLVDTTPVNDKSQAAYIRNIIGAQQATYTNIVDSEHLSIGLSSLELSTFVPDEDSGENPIEYYQLYKFNDKTTITLPTSNNSDLSDDSLSNYNFVLRRFNPELSTFNIEYLNVADMMYAIGDANLSSSLSSIPILSSIELKEFVDPDTETSTKYFQLYKFEKTETLGLPSDYEDLISVLNTVDFVIRNKDEKNTSYIDYINAAKLVTIGDANIKDIEFNSVEKIVDENSESYLQLYNFNKNETIDLPDYEDEKRAALGNIDLIVRDKTNNSTTDVSYVNALDLYQSPISANYTGDANIVDTSCYSIEKLSNENDGQYFQLYMFDKDITTPVNALSDINLVVRRKTDDNSYVIEYISADLLSSSEISADSDITDINFKSIQISRIDSDDKKYVQLYNFEKVDTADLSIVIDAENQSIPEYWNILVRENDLGGGGTLKYATLSINLSSLSGNASGNVTTDTELTATGLQSIDKKYSEDISAEYITLYNFDKTEKDLTLSVSKSHPNLPENIQILVKDTDNYGLTILKYADLSVDFSRTLSTDTEVKHLIGTGNTQRSINIVHSNQLNGDYLELYNFANGSNGPYRFLPNKLGYEENAYSTKHTFVCRQTDEYGTNPEVAYMDVKVVYPEGDDSSITYNKEDETAYKYELYQWSDHDVEEINVLIDVNNVTREQDVLPSIAPYHKFLTYGPDGNLNYIDLKLDVKRRVEADSELENISKTIQLKYNDDIPYFCLYGLDKTPVEKTVLLKENDEVNTGIKYVALNGNEIEIQELKIKLPDLSSGDNYEGDIYNISSSVTILSTVVEDIEEQLSNFWVLGENADKCYGKAIGDSNKNEVISLDGKTLAGDWSVMGNAAVNGTIQCNALTASNYIGCAGDVICNGLTASSYIGCTGDIMCNGLTASTYINCAGDIMCDDLNCNNITCTNIICDSLTLGGTTINGQQLARLLALIN